MSELADGYSQILALFDGSTAMHRIFDDVPALSGVDVAWVDEPDGGDQIVLRHMVNSGHHRWRAAFEADVAVDAEPGQGGDFLAAQPWSPPLVSSHGQPDRLGADPRPV